MTNNKLPRTITQIKLNPYTYDSTLARLYTEETSKDTNTKDREGNPLSDEGLEIAIQKYIDAQLADNTENEDSASENKSPVTEDTAPSITVAISHLTGLKSVKEKLAVYEKIVMFNQMRQACNLRVNPQPLHAMFLGSPGTGKTTVAKRMGLMLRKAGILSKGHVVIKERATLLGPNYSNEETNTLRAIEEAQGGILFIDEAYQLYQQDDPRDPGKFVIETLMSALADESKRDWMLILAGYSEEMKRMIEINPGFRSRIPESNIYTFEDFSKEELMEIAEKYLQRNNYSLSDDARRALSKRLAADYAARDKNFGNARYVINLIQTEILPAMAVRVVSGNDINQETLSTIKPSDIPEPAKGNRPSRAHIGFRA